MRVPLVSLDCPTGLLRRYYQELPPISRPTHIAVLDMGYNVAEELESFRTNPPYRTRVTRDLPYLLEV